MGRYSFLLRQTRLALGRTFAAGCADGLAAGFAEAVFAAVAEADRMVARDFELATVDGAFVCAILGRFFVAALLTDHVRLLFGKRDRPAPQMGAG